MTFNRVIKRHPDGHPALSMAVTNLALLALGLLIICCSDTKVARNERYLYSCSSAFIQYLIHVWIH